MLKEKCTSYPSQHSFYSLKKKLPWKFHALKYENQVL
jgi:hypothetical protein